MSGGVDPRGLSAGSAASPETDYAVALCGAEKAAKDIAKPRTHCVLAGRVLPFVCRRRLAVSSILHAQGFAAALAGGGIFIPG